MESTVRKNIDKRDMVLINLKKTGLISIIITLFSIILIWHVVGSTTTGRLLISQPLLVIDYVYLHLDEVSKSMIITALESYAGLIISIIFSLVFGVFSVYFPQLTRFSYPFLLASQVIPFVCLAPLIILIFGFGVSGKIVLSALMSFFPIVTNILTSMRQVPPPPLELMMLMNANKKLTIQHIFIPYGLPYFFAGIKVASPLAVIGAIVAEFNGAEYGIGKDIFLASKRLEPELMMFGLIAAAMLSASLFLIISLIENNIGDWYKKGNI